MSNNLKEVVQRHGLDRYKDAGFIALAVLMTMLAIGSVTSRAAGTTSPHKWQGSVVVQDADLSLAK